MKIVFEKKDPGFKITFKNGFDRATSFKVKNEAEAMNTLRHYFFKKHNNKNCALCKNVHTNISR